MTGLVITFSSCVVGLLIGLWDPWLGAAVVILGGTVGLWVTWGELS